MDPNQPVVTQQNPPVPVVPEVPPVAPTPSTPPAVPVEPNIPGQENQKKILPLMKIAIVLAIVAVLAVVAYVFRAKFFAAQPTPVPLAVVTSSPTPDVTANWETYQGKYFSFKHPQSWTDNIGPATNDPDSFEVVGFRISPNAVFETSYKNYSYEKSVQGLADRKSSKLTVSNREAVRFEMTGSGDVLPLGFSIISFVVKGMGNRSYTIVFNGDREDITEELINQTLSTFKFFESIPLATP